MGKKKQIKKELKNENTKDISESIEKAIIDANIRIKYEDYNNSKAFIDWLGTILIFLIIMFIVIIASIAYVATRLFIVNIQNGIYISWLNIDLIGIIFIAILMIIHTYKVKKHIDDVKSISDLTGISSFLISCFALLISLLAILMKV